MLDQNPRDAAESMFIEPPQRKFWTREMDAIKVPDSPEAVPDDVLDDPVVDGPDAGPDPAPDGQ